MSVSLPRLSFLPPPEAPKPKLCFGDLYRAAAPPPPPEFTPNDKTLEWRERISRRNRAWRERQPKRPKSSFFLPWSPQVDARLLELIDDFQLPRRVVAERLTAEFGWSVKKPAVIRRYHILKRVGAPLESPSCPTEQP